MTGPPQRSIAFFDLDHTLVDGDSDTSFLDFLAQEGAIDPALLECKAAISDAYMEGRPWQDDYRELLGRVYGGLEVAAVEALAVRHADERVLPMLFEGARDLVEAERGRRVELCLLTTTNQIVVEPVAAKLGLDHVLSTRLEITGDRFSGRLEGGEFCTGPVKASRLVARCAERAVVPEHCAMFGDGRSDMQALAVVGQPRAVHPNDELRRVASERGWPVLDLVYAGELWEVPNE
ncbi:MAG: HAD-IB family hydrolase [Planctomycetota bacterium]